MINEDDLEQDNNTFGEKPFFPITGLRIRYDVPGMTSPNNTRKKSVMPANFG